MKKLTFLILTCALALSSCDNELEVAAPWKDIPVVYGILTPSDTAQYIRIEKAFLDPNTSATDIARIPDSLYYQELDAAIIDLSGNRRIQLVAVDGALEGYTRDEGVFAENPNVLYKALTDDIELQGGRRYRLEINRGDELPLVFTEIEQVERPNVKRPQQGEQVRFVYDRDYRVLWEEADNAFFYDVSFVIRYDEFPTGEPLEFETLELEWPVSRNSTQTESEILGVLFYQYLGDQLLADPDISRRFRGLDCFVRSGGEELFTFRQIQLANSGITGAGGELPQFSNMSEGLGILTSSDFDGVLDLGLHPETLDSLRGGIYTEDLNFQ